jgi:hypothetical protein
MEFDPHAPLEKLTLGTRSRRQGNGRDDAQTVRPRAIWLAAASRDRASPKRVARYLGYCIRPW